MPPAWTLRRHTRLRPPIVLPAWTLRKIADHAPSVDAPQTHQAPPTDRGTRDARDKQAPMGRAARDVEGRTLASAGLLTEATPVFASQPTRSPRRRPRGTADACFEKTTTSVSSAISTTERFAQKYGRFRRESVHRAQRSAAETLRRAARSVAGRFGTCGDHRHGVARIRCTNPECGHDHFRPFSCKGFYLCTGAHDHHAPTDARPSFSIDNSVRILDRGVQRSLAEYVSRPAISAQALEEDPL